MKPLSNNYFDISRYSWKYLSLMWATDILEFWQFCYEVFFIYNVCGQQIFQYLKITLKKKIVCVEHKEQRLQNFKISLRARVRRLLLFWCFLWLDALVGTDTYFTFKYILSMFVCLFAYKYFKYFDDICFWCGQQRMTDCDRWLPPLI